MLVDVSLSPPCSGVGAQLDVANSVLGRVILFYFGMRGAVFGAACGKV